MLVRAYEGVLFVCLAVAAAMLAAMMGMVSADVVLRNLAGREVPWSIEVSEYILYLSTFLAAPAVLRHGGHVRVDVVLRVLPPGPRERMEVLAHLVGLAVSLVLLVYGALAALEAYRLGSVVLKQLAVPEWWLLSVIPFTSGLLAVEFLLHLLGQRGDPRDGTAARLPVKSGAEASADAGAPPAAGSRGAAREEGRPGKRTPRSLRLRGGPAQWPERTPARPPLTQGG